MTTSPGVRIGIDVGGTFTDLVARDASGATWSLKVPTTPAAPAEGVLGGIEKLRPDTGPWASLAHGTTLVTNAIVERRGARVGLVTTRGFRDVLEIARQNRTHLYRLDLPAKPEPPVPRHLRLEVSERVGPDGAVVAPLALDEVPALVAALRSRDVESVAVCLLHGYANPAHEAGAPPGPRAALPAPVRLERDQRGVPRVRAHVHHGAQRRGDAAGDPLSRRPRRPPRPLGGRARSTCSTPPAA